MGCVSSKLIRKEVEREILCSVDGGYYRNHVVSLTSSTYGALKLDKEEEKKEEEEEAEVINAWELMGDLEEESIRGPKTKTKTKTVVGIGNGRSPFKRLNKSASPKKANKLTPGKENSNSNYQRVSSSRRKSLSPLFDPELVEAYEKELCQEQEQEEEEEEQQIKKIISVNSSGLFDCSVADFKSKCPPKGEDSVVVYTTTLRGIRKTFEECNTVRSILESHQIRMYERDVSMDSGFKEELRKLMGVDEFRIPLVFVKARLIGGADEISKLEEEGKLGSLLHRIPRNSSSVCQGCGGVRFIMCVDCSGSCKVLDEEHKNTVRCGECNENGLIHCPLCC